LSAAFLLRIRVAARDRAARPPAIARKRVLLRERRQPRGRLGRPEEIAAIAAFLAGDETGMIVGVNIVADGGVTIRMYE
jgi:NAD(P)-dependent dehydrogenase (short-subunit alcohol dehydrogenase family)